MVAELVVRRGLFRPDRGRARQPRLCRPGDPQLPPPLADGDPRYADIQQKLAALPPITVPATTLDGDGDGVSPATDGSSSATRFTGRRVHRVEPRAGHNLPQEAPEAFAAAVMELIKA
jgi:pimeloyl-ACP methyl ester carboxylesterase